MQFTALLFYIFAVFIRPQEWIPALEGFPLVDFIAGITILLTIMAVTTKRMYLPRVPENIFMVGFFLATLISHIVHGYLGGFILAFQDIGKTLIFYFLIVIIVDKVYKVRIIGWLLVFSALFMAISGILQYFKGVGFAGIMPIMDDRGTVRVIGYGIFSDPNDLALFFAAALPFVFAFFLERRSFYAGAIAAISGALILLAAWCTNSRSGILAIIVAGLMFFRRRYRGATWVLLAVIFIIVMAAFLPSRFTGGLLDKSSYERIIYWGFGNQMFKANPIFGVGYAMFASHAGWHAAHNSFVQCYAELGFFGYFFWIALLYSVLYGLWTLKDRGECLGEKQNLVLDDAILASIAGYLTAGLLLSRAYILPLYILIGLGVKMRYLSTKGKYMVGDLLPAGFNRRIIYICVGSIAAIYVATKFFLTRF